MDEAEYKDLIYKMLLDLGLSVSSLRLAVAEMLRRGPNGSTESAAEISKYLGIVHNSLDSFIKNNDKILGNKND